MVKVKAGKAEGPIAKFFNEEQMTKLLKAMDASDNDLLLFVSDAKYNVVCDALAALRNHLGKELKLFNPDEFAFLWVVDFPMFEYDDELNVIMRFIIHLLDLKIVILIKLKTILQIV